MESTLRDKNIESLKKMLLSRDTNLQMKAVNLINDTFDTHKGNKDYESILQNLISTDLCNHLSEASATLDVQLLKKIVLSMKHFSHSYLFYKNSCAPYVTAAFVRAAHLYIKEEHDSSILQSILYFFIESFARIDRYELPPILSKESSYDATQLFNLLDSICETENKNIDSFLLGSKILHIILSKKNTYIKISIKIVESIVTIVEKYLEKLHSILLEKNVTFDQTDKYVNCVFGMICHICVDIIEFCHSIEKRLITFIISKPHKVNQSQYQITMIEKLMDHVHKMMTSIVGKIHNYETSMDFPCHEIFFRFLNLFLNEPMVQEIMPTFALYLLENDFLVYLPRIRATSNNDNFRKLCQINIAEILVILSYEEFDLSTWKGGKSGFKHHIYVKNGLLSYDEDIMTLLQKQFNSFKVDATLDAIIIFLYFSCINSEERLAQLLLPQIVWYILSISKTMCPSPILKCLWLIFATANSPETNILYPIENKLVIENANYKLATLVSYDMEKVYTHNIIIIKWIFSSANIPFYAQYEVLSLWLQKEKSIPSNLMSLAAIWWSLVELVRNGPKSVLENATHILKLCIDENQHDSNITKIKSNLWEFLPDTLTGYLEDEQSKDDEKLVCMLDLCSTYITSELEEAIIQRSAILLVAVLPTINKSNENLIFHILKQVFCLLGISLKKENTIVLSQFVNSKILLEILYYALKYSNVSLSCMACKILSILTFYSYNNNLECETTISIDSLFIIELLKIEKNEEKCVALLQILYTSFKALCNSKPNKKILLSLPLNFESETVLDTFYGLYYRLQMMCCKESKMQSEGAWQCLKQMLQYSLLTNNQKVIEKLSAQPWTGILIRFQLSQNDLTKVSVNFLKFVETWLNSMKVVNSKNDDISQRKLLDDNYSIFFKPVNFLYHTLNDENILSKLDENKKHMISNILSIISEL